MEYHDPHYNVVVDTNITYNTNVGWQIGDKLDVYRPTNYRFDGPTWSAGDQPPTPINGRPCVIWAHGGGFRYGSKGQSDATYFGIDWASRGWIVLVIDYRILINYSYPQSEIYAICDMRAAVRWAKANAVARGIDATKIVTAGDSAGGGIAVFGAIGDWEEPNSSDWPANSGAGSRPAGVLNCWGATKMKFDFTQLPFTTNIGAGRLDVLFNVHGKKDSAQPPVYGVDPADSRALIAQINAQRGSGKAFFVELTNAMHTPWFAIANQYGPAQGYYDSANVSALSYFGNKLALF